jgi:phage-related protein|tara:strand:+ start:423 stop:1400 length:978 start_codon:yes stop_codon:yes gene_type:complete
MSESLFYNRNRNFSGADGTALEASGHLEDYGLTPNYGSSVSFKSSSNSYTTDDFYYELVPLSANSLTAEFNVQYSVHEHNASGLANFFESKSGFTAFEFNADNSGIYKNLSGFCEQYSIQVNNNQNFTFNAKVAVDTAPNLFNWSGNNFTNLEFQGWVPSNAYKKYDVVHSGINNNNLNNFYYCTGDHTSSAANSPAGASTMWTQKFFFEPDQTQQFNVGIKSDKTSFKNSFVQRLGGKKNTQNIAKFDTSYSYTNITDLQLKSMLHFLENKGGYRRFEHDIPSVYNRPKVYYSPSWNHTWVYANSNNLTVTLVEDPLGIIPTGS